MPVPLMAKCLRTSLSASWDGSNIRFIVESLLSLRLLFSPSFVFAELHLAFEKYVSIMGCPCAVVTRLRSGCMMGILPVFFIIVKYNSGHEHKVPLILQSKLSIQGN